MPKQHETRIKQKSTQEQPATFFTDVPNKYDF